MSNYPDVKFTLGQGGLGRTAPNTDGICGMVTTGVATTATATTSALPLNTSVKLLSVIDAESYGLSDAYDATNKVLVYYHISEFFRINPNGILWLRIVAQTQTLTNLTNKAVTNNALQLLIDANGEINTLAINRNPLDTYTPTLSGGLDADVLSAVQNAQALADAEFVNHRPLYIIIEGRSFNGSAAAATDLRASAPAAPNVSVCIGQDFSKVGTSSIDVIKASACIGTMLGAVSKAAVHENIGWVQNFDLSDSTHFKQVSLSSFNQIGTYTDTDLAALYDKGYVFVRRYVGNTGAYFCGQHTSVSVTSDYAYGMNIRTINKAIKAVYLELLPRLNSPLLLDSAGKMAPETLGGFRAAALRGLDNLSREGNISDREVYLDPNQNVLAANKVNVRIRIIPVGFAEGIEVNIGFTASLA